MNDTPYGLETLRVYGEGFAGRQAELAALDQAWEGGVRIFVLYAEGGAGKTRVIRKWLTQMGDDGYRGAGGVFVHSFYSQGSDERRNASSELFFEKALEYFGHTGPLITDPTEQGRTLARLIREQRGLLVLDGLEPLQHPLSFDEGRLKDPAIRALLLALAAGRLGDSSSSPSGLCVVTSRQPVQEFKDKTGRVICQQPLERLDADAGVQLLRELEVRGPDRELRQAVEDCRGHAYSLMLLGTYLRDATDDHEIQRRREIPLLDQDKEHRYHARHLFGAYVEHLGEASPELSVLRLLGFFDRPAEEKLVSVLREAIEPGLDSLTAPIRKLSSTDWRRVLSRLKALRLIDTPSSDTSTLDSHPLPREHFAEQLRTHLPEAWQAGHQRLFEFLCHETEYQPDTLAGLQPLYQAIVHGCLAGLYKRALTEVYCDRILRKRASSGFYSIRKLGAIGANLSAMTYFFATPWTALKPNIPPSKQAWVLGDTAYFLRALGRLSEAVPPMRDLVEMSTAQKNWAGAASATSNLSDLELTRGEILAAVTAGKKALEYADLSETASLQVIMRGKLADILHQAGRRSESRDYFENAESIQAAILPETPRLSSIGSFLYCDLLLSEAERAAWQHCLLVLPTVSVAASDGVIKRAARTLAWAIEQNNLLDIALNHLTLIRAELYKVCAGSLLPPNIHGNVAAAINGLRAASVLHHLPHGLLTRAWLRLVSGDVPGCREDLDEAWEIAERGPMPLHQADILLYRARLFRDRTALAEARRLIEKHGYYRRSEELADAEAAAEHWDDKEPSMPKSTKTFISYSHDSEEHSQRVLALANRLRAQGVDTEIDQYETRPPQGWPRWCEEQLRPDRSEFVLVVCTETYLKRIEGRVSADEGRGVFWEGSVIYNYIYDQKSNGRFLPVLFHPQDDEFIPVPLKGATRFYLKDFELSDTGYKALYRELTLQTPKRPPLGEVVVLERGFDVRRGGEPETKVLPPMAPREVRSTFPSSAAAPPAPDLLDELKGLPPAWFDELVYRFDQHNAVSARPAPQSIRAIDLLNIVRATEDGPDRLREEIRRLKGDRG